MDRKRSFQSQSRFERAKTPMGAVPISVIMGFDYPLGDMEPSGRGEAPSSYSYKSDYSSGYSSNMNTNYMNTNYMNTNMLERIPRTSTQLAAATTPSSYRTPTQRSYLGRGHTEIRDTMEKNPSFHYSPSSALEHPKQQPCQYATALSLTSSPLPRQVRARTIAPSTPTPWRQTTFHQARPSVSAPSSHYYSQAGQASYNRFSAVRSRFA